MQPERNLRGTSSLFLLKLWKIPATLLPVSQCLRGRTISPVLVPTGRSYHQAAPGQHPGMETNVRQEPDMGFFNFSRMGALPEEKRDRKAWASCLCGGIAATDDNEVEAEEVRKMRLEREARWEAENSAIAQSTCQLPTAAAITGNTKIDEEAKLHTADEVRLIVMSQPQRIESMSARPPCPPLVVIKAPAIVEEVDGSRASTPIQRTHAPSSRPSSTAPDRPQSSIIPRPVAAKHDAIMQAVIPARKITQQEISPCPLCDSADHTEDRCPRLEGIPILPTKGMAPAMNVR
ncbi:hypothetical protein CERZMDRAFT_103373 [Cercospora zeae-maydis SCOH1-5]|uniref:Uncharacterized protein n=1 Tax=Cercospora zeae-maydis SCOH1-5 TaxID=717836 RepID=A0A6A6F1R4_9PEZI|nr:hypothetical protein CERZMDRAFT_103373 [Cercospora zeae-maydis SCOH1-5]